MELDQEILAQLGEVKWQIRDLRTVLMGSGDAGETKHGRLPMVESAVESLQSRVTVTAEHLGARIAALEKRSIAQALITHTASALSGGIMLWFLEHGLSLIFGK